MVDLDTFNPVGKVVILTFVFSKGKFRRFIFLDQVGNIPYFDITQLIAKIEEKPFFFYMNLFVVIICK